jgi:transcriptional regulator with XRE-family HTH domain
VSEIGKRVGTRIRELRTQGARRWTQEELAERAHISVSFLSMIERGERVPHLETLFALASALEVRLSELFLDGVDGGMHDGDLLRPLMDFVRTRKLSPNDVEKLLGVARAMFTASSQN